MTNTLTTTIPGPTTTSLPRRVLLASAAIAALATVGVVTANVTGSGSDAGTDRTAAASTSSAGAEASWALQPSEAAFIAGVSTSVDPVVASWALQPEEAAFIAAPTGPATAAASSPEVGCSVGVPC